MTDFDLIEKFRKLTERVGPVVPFTLAHTLAGVSRARMWWMRNHNRVPVELFERESFVPLRWIEERTTAGGKLSLMDRLVRRQQELFSEGALFACFRIPELPKRAKPTLRRKGRKVVKASTGRRGKRLTK